MIRVQGFMVPETITFMSLDLCGSGWYPYGLSNAKTSTAFAVREGGGLGEEKISNFKYVNLAFTTV